MLEGNPIRLANGQEDVQRHAAACLSVDQCINAQRNPNLVRLIDLQLSRLLSHPDVMQSASNRDLFPQLLEDLRTVFSLLTEARTLSNQRAP